MWEKSWQTPALVERATSMGESALVELGVELVEGAERVVLAADVEVLAEVFELGGELCEFTGEEHLPEVALVDEAVEFVPGAVGEGLRDFVMDGHLDERFGDDDELAVLAGDVEVVDVIGEVVAVREDATSRADGEMKGEAPLLGVGARVHARLHDAFADGSLVEKLGQMADRVVHRSLLRMLHGVRHFSATS